MDRAKDIGKAVASFVLVLFAGAATGSIVRGEWSPWLSVELGHRQFAASLAVQLVGIAWYLAFYSLGFLLPFWSVTLALFVRRLQAAGHGAIPEIPRHHRIARRYLSAAGFVLSLLFLESIVAFLQHVPIDIWNGWLLILGTALAFVFAYYGYLALRASPTGVRAPFESQAARDEQ